MHVVDQSLQHYGFELLLLDLGAEVLGIILAKVLDVDQEHSLQTLLQNMQLIGEVIEVFHQFQLGLFNHFPVHTKNTPYPHTVSHHRSMSIPSRYFQPPTPDSLEPSSYY